MSLPGLQVSDSFSISTSPTQTSGSHASLQITFVHWGLLTFALATLVAYV